MLEPAFPEDEDRRIQALRALAILDTPPEARFDRITAIAKELFEVPICLISLVDANRQWFKSCQGLGASETPRNISFCGHAILRDEIFCIPNTLEDERFADNPLVTEPPNIRFYAGAPLTVNGDARIGTLCIIDDRPREFSARELANLRHLADWAQDELGALKLADAVQLIRTQEAQLHAIISGMTDTVLTVGADGTVHSANRVLESMFGIPEQQLLNTDVRRILPNYQPRAMQLEPDAATQDVLTQELTGMRKDGSRFPVELSQSVMALPEENLWILAVRDITSRKEVENMKREFISIVSHELRTPLTSIRGALGLMAGGAVGNIPPKAADMLNIAHDNCERLVFLVNDILDMEKLSQGKLAMEAKPQALLPIIEHAVELNQAYAASLDVSLTIETGDADLVAAVDENRLIQVMNNLLSNAAKHTPLGSSVRVRLEAQQDQARISVQDDGPGIAPQLQDSVFEKFRQLDSVDNRGTSGTGLGLCIAKGIVEAFDGQIGVDSEPDQGATFFFTLPLVDAGDAGSAA